MLLGSNSGPVQWPDCNRYTEAIIVQLCNLHPGPERSCNKTTSRWTLVCKDYRGIQERVMNSGMVMRETWIQLPDNKWLMLNIFFAWAAGNSELGVKNFVVVLKYQHLLAQKKFCLSKMKK